MSFTPKGAKKNTNVTGWQAAAMGGGREFVKDLPPAPRVLRHMGRLVFDEANGLPITNDHGDVKISPDNIAEMPNGQRYDLNPTEAAEVTKLSPIFARLIEGTIALDN